MFESNISSQIYEMFDKLSVWVEYQFRNSRNVDDKFFVIFDDISLPELLLQAVSFISLNTFQETQIENVKNCLLLSIFDHLNTF